MAGDFLANLKNAFLDFIFPKACFGCGTEGSYLCADCLATMDVLNSAFCLCSKPKILSFPGKCSLCRNKSLNGLYFAVAYKNSLAQKLIHSFKYSPYIKEIAESLALLIITHLKLTEREKDLKNAVLVPIPLAKKRLRERGYNQSEEIARLLAKEYKIPLITGCLEKVRPTKNQMELSGVEREQNLKGVFAVKGANGIFGKKIFLVDDVYTTGATMEECARVLKEAGTREVWGIVAARG